MSWDCCKSQAIAGPLRHTASLSLFSLETDTVQLPAFRLLYSSPYLTAAAAPARRSDGRNITASKCLITREDKIYTLPAQTLLHVFPLFPFYTPLRFLQTLWHASSCIWKLCLRFRLAKEKNDLETKCAARCVRGSLCCWLWYGRVGRPSKCLSKQALRNGTSRTYHLDNVSKFSLLSNND